MLDDGKIMRKFFSSPQHPHLPIWLVYISQVSGRVKRRVRKSMFNSTSVNSLVK